MRARPWARASDGDDEFAWVLPETDERGAQWAAAALVQANASETFVFDGATIAFTVSVGVVTVPGERDGPVAPDQLLALAHERLGTAKGLSGSQ